MYTINNQHLFDVVLIIIDRRPNYILKNVIVATDKKIKKLYLFFLSQHVRIVILLYYT